MDFRCFFIMLFINLSMSFADVHAETKYTADRRLSKFYTLESDLKVFDEKARNSVLKPEDSKIVPSAPEYDVRRLLSFSRFRYEF